MPYRNRCISHEPARIDFVRDDVIFFVCYRLDFMGIIMSDYEKQAQDFLESTGTELTVEYSHCGKYFPADKESRAVFEFTLCRAGKSYTGTFGQSIAAGDKMPSDYDILACLDYWEGNFEDFCGEYGYSDDSISALNTYNAVIKQSVGLKELFTFYELEKLGEIS